jgi:triosephosphate isomerase (TIM)
MSVRPLIAGNWKMNGLQDSVSVLQELIGGLSQEMKGKADLALCLPATLIMSFAEKARSSGILIGAQDCHAQTFGAHTGDLSAEMLVDAGASLIITGHSERRSDHHESNEDVRTKTLAVWRAGATAILCVGESRDEREKGETLNVIRHQIQNSVPRGGTAQNLIIAYEPVWAIGTGLTPTADDVASVHALIREELKILVGPASQNDVKILYGGSVKPSNAKELLHIPHVNGALVGGASLKADDFLGIVKGLS